jgi:spectinomycin phosphotransferase
VRYRPAGIADEQVSRALTDGWGLRAETLRYAPVGGGSYHWIVTEAGQRRFVTVDDLDDKPWLGGTRPEVLTGLRTAMAAAVTLREQGLDFVAAPLPMHNGGTVGPLDDQFTISVFPYLDGVTGSWGDTLTGADRAELLAMLAALHQATVPSPQVPIGLPGRAALEEALADLPRPWAGPHAEDARALLTRHEDRIRTLLGTYDDLAETVIGLPKVLTHGEPHPGNVMRLPGRLMLLDWDTVGLAPAERDLWLVGTEAGPDTEALAFYRLRWALADIAAYAAGLHSENLAPETAPQIWTHLRTSIDRIS